ncbi:hypothetical protein ACS5PN_15835 [Roseateles sp. NT4]|uniref:hypothetical protein n=1 Tax=Roseateles sp. NT4 TaxID=3453715 RepID=UPI003EEBA356
MNSHPASLDSYFAAWNARDAASIRRHLGEAFGANTRYLDPHRSATGIDEFAACLQAFRAESPDAVISWASGVDSHHQLHRYAWELHVGERRLSGYDVVELDENGRMAAVLSFFGPLPPLPSLAPAAQP